VPCLARWSLSAPRRGSPPRPCSAASCLPAALRCWPLSMAGLCVALWPASGWPGSGGSAHSDVPTADEHLLPEVLRAPEGLDASALGTLRSFFDDQFVDDWITDARRRGLISEAGSGSDCRLVITQAGRQLCEQLFPSSIEVSLPAAQRRPGESVPRRLRRLFGR